MTNGPLKFTCPDNTYRPIGSVPHWN